MSTILRWTAVLLLLAMPSLPHAAGQAGVVGAKLSGPVTWGTPDKPYGKRRSITSADVALIARYRSGKLPPVFSTSFTDDAELKRDWNEISDDNTWGGYRSCRRPENVQVSLSGLRLKTLLAKDCKNKWSTGSIISKHRFSYGFFEARMKIADIKGLNNAFWMTTDDYLPTGDHFEIDISEVQYPSYDHLGLQQYPAKGNAKIAHTGMGWGANLNQNLSANFHDYGVLWTPTEVLYEIDGQPIAAAVTGGAVHPPTNVALSTALVYTGIPDHPEGHDLQVRSIRIVELEK